LSEFVGTPYYLAPEIINEEPYSNECDIWSLGVVAYFIISGEYPFNGTKRRELFKNICSGNVTFKSPIWTQVTGNCKDFIKDCLTVDQKRRPTAASLL
jgi:serine/threonine protein kinase